MAAATAAGTNSLELLFKRKRPNYGVLDLPLDLEKLYWNYRLLLIDARNTDIEIRAAISAASKMSRLSFNRLKLRTQNPC